MVESALLRGLELVLWAELHPYLTGVVVTALLVPGLVCCWAARRGAVVAQSTLGQIDERLTQISAAVTLLTDTSEAAFRTAFSEIERLSGGHPSRALRRADLPARVKTSTRQGRTAREIAQAEGVAEGEVRLRLRLAEAATEAPAPQDMLQ